MRTSCFPLLLILSTLFLGWSCEKEEEKEDPSKAKFPIPDGWTRNNDLAEFDKKSWFLYRSGVDSIKLELYQFTIKFDYGGMRYEAYKKNESGEYYLYRSDYIHDAYSIEQDEEKVIFGDYRDKPYSFGYEIADEETIYIHNLPGLKPFSQKHKFEAVNERYLYDNNSLLLGGWYNSQVLDSTVIAFDDNVIKEILFVRGTSSIQDSWNYGAYRASLRKPYLQNELLGTHGDINFKDFNEDYPYKIEGNKLTIYWKAPRKATIYTRIKQ